MTLNSDKRVWTLLALFLVAGCSASVTSDADPAPAKSPATQATTSDAGDVELLTLSFDEIEQLIAGKRGKVVVMDAWSTACPPCMKDFHNLVELHRQYGPDDVACVSLSFDYEGLGKPEDVQGRVLDFLRSQGATFDNVLSNEESDVLYRKFALNSVPAVFVYDRSGKLRERFESEGAYEQVRALVAELIAESAADENRSATE